MGLQIFWKIFFFERKILASTVFGGLCAFIVLMLRKIWIFGGLTFGPLDFFEGSLFSIRGLCGGMKNILASSAPPHHSCT